MTVWEMDGGVGRIYPGDAARNVALFVWEWIETKLQIQKKDAPFERRKGCGTRLLVIRLEMTFQAGSYTLRKGTLKFKVKFKK
jgi:hypothetical protein